MDHLCLCYSSDWGSDVCNHPTSIMSFISFALLLVSVDKELGYEGEGFAWLEEKELEDFSVSGAPYVGPKIVEN